jgi:hypothetical protein
MLVVLITLIALGFVFRIALSLMLPWTLRYVARKYDLNCEYERSDIYLFSGDVGLWHVRLTWLADGQEFARADYCRADISPLELLRGRLVVQRLETDGVALTIDLGAYKHRKAGETKATTPTAKASTDKPVAIDLAPPVAIDALRLSHVQTHLVDKSVTPNFDTNVEMNLRISDVASTKRPARLTVELLPSDLVDSLVFDLTADEKNTPAQFDANFTFSARGLNFNRLQGYLALFGIRAAADGLAAKAHGSISARLVRGKTDQITGKIALEGMSMGVAEQPAISLKEMTIDIGAIGPDLAQIKSVKLKDGSFDAGRTSSGALQLAGLEWLPKAPAAEESKQTAQKAAAPAPSAPVADQAPAPFVWSVGELSLVNFAAKFRDERVTPKADLNFKVDELKAMDIVSDPGKADAPMTLIGRFHADRLTGPITINGNFRPFAAKRTMALAVKVEQVKPDALQTYLKLAGIESQLESATFTCDMTADVASPDDKTLVANACLKNVLWKDSKELFKLATVNISGLGLAGGDIRIDAVDVDGPQFDVKRDAAGGLRALGFRLPAKSPASPDSPKTTASHKSETTPAAPASPKVAAAEKVAASKSPILKIGRFTWKDVKLHFDDREVTTGSTHGAEVVIQDAGITLNDVQANLNIPSVSCEHIEMHMRAPGLAGELKLEGKVTGKPAGFSGELELTGRNLSAALAAPYLKAMNIEPTLRDGSVHAMLHVDLTAASPDEKSKQARPQGLADYHANIKASAVAFRDGVQEMFAVDHADITDIDYRSGLAEVGNSMEIGNITLTNPRGKFVREEDGAIRAMGIRLLKKKKPEPKKSAFASAPSASPGAAGPAAPASPVATAAAVPAAPSPPASSPAARAAIPASGPATTPALATATSPPSKQPAPAPPDVFVLKQLTITGGSFTWTDQAVAPAAEIVARVKGGVTGVTWGCPADPAKIDFTLNADGFADAVTVAGSVGATPTSGALALTLSASGLRQGKLAPYLPPGMTVDMKDGRFSGTLDASASLDANGAVSGNVTLSKLSLRDGPTNPPLLQLDRAFVAIAKLDLPDTVAINEISTSGAEASARKSADGVMHVAGIALGKPPETPATRPVITAATAPATAPAVSVRSTTAQVSAPPAAPGATAAPVSAAVAAAPAAASGAMVLEKQSYPLISIKKLDLNLRRFTFADETHAGAAPVVVSKLCLATNRPFEALGDDPSSHAPIELNLTFQVDDVVDRVLLTAQVTPFASQPTLNMDLAATGIRGDGLLALFPELKPKIDGSLLTDGQFHLHVDAQMKIDRLTPVDFSFERGATCDFLMKGLQFQAKRGGQVLAGIDEIRSEGVEVRPDKGALIVRTLEVNKITGRGELEKDGLHVLGVVLREEETAPAATNAAGPAQARPTVPAVARSNESPTKPPPVASPAPAAPPSPTATPAAPAAAGGGEIRMGKVVVSGIDFRFEDHTVSPAMIIPLNQLDLDARDLSSRALVENRKTRFSLLIGADKVPLPRRTQQGAGAMLKDAGALLTGQKVDTAVVMEQRALFSQIQVDGVLSFYPKTNGWVKTSLSSVDLAAFKSKAKQAGVSLNNGVFDMSIDARMPGDGTMSTQSHFTFTDLEYQEPPDGPVMRFLHPPPPIDTIDLLLTFLRDQDGSIDVPLDVPVKMKPGEVMPPTGTFVSEAVKAFTVILVKAAAAAPLKAASVATDVVGALVPIPIPGVAADKTPKKQGPIVLTFAQGDTGLSPAAPGQLAELIAQLKEPNVEVTLRHELGGGDIYRARALANPSPEDRDVLIDRLVNRKQRLQRQRAEWIARARGDLASRLPADAKVALDRLHAVERDLAAAEDALDHLYELKRPDSDSDANRATRTRHAALQVAQARLETLRAALNAQPNPGLDSRIHLTRPQYPSAVPAGNQGGKVEITITVKKKN